MSDDIIKLFTKKPNTILLLNSFRFRSTSMGHHGRNISDKPQVRCFGLDGQLLLVPGLHPNEDFLHGMRGYRYTLCILAVRRVLYPGPVIHCVPVARNWRQNITGNPRHAARSVHFQQPQDDQTDHIIYNIITTYKIYKSDWLLFFFGCKLI